MYGVNVGVDIEPPTLARRLRRCGPVRRRRKAARSAGSRPRTCRASISRWISCRSKTAASAREPVQRNEPILAAGKHVVVIGGGDTGSDCIGTSIRQGALSVTQLEIMPSPPEKENKLLTWPNWPLKLRTSSSQEEGAKRDFSVLTKAIHRRGRRRQEDRLRASRRQVQGNSRQRRSNSGPISCCSPWASFRRCRRDCWTSLGVKLDPRGNVAADQLSYKTIAAEGVRLRRHAARPVAGRLGDPRRPPGGAVGRYFPDGIQRAAALDHDAFRSN